MKGLKSLTILTLATAVAATSLPNTPNSLSPRSPHAVALNSPVTHRMVKRSSKRCRSKSDPNKHSDDDGDDGGDGGDDDDDDDDDDFTSVVKKSTKSSSKGGSGGSFKVTQLTFYGGEGDSSSQLANPSCFDGNWNPDADSVYGVAIGSGWSGKKPKCGEFLKFGHGGKSVVVRVIDTCDGDGCSGNACDLTPKAFAALAELSVGVIKSGITCEGVDAPSSWSKSKYGPQKCAGDGTD